MAGTAEDSEVSYVVGSALTERDEVVALPIAREEWSSAGFAFAFGAFEAVASVPRVFRILVSLSIRVAFVARRLVDLWVVEIAVAFSRRAPAD